MTINVSWYRNRCGDQLIDFPTPALSGFTSVIANSPALVQNTGWEFTVGAHIINTKKFNWSLSFNTAINRNKLVAYPDFELSPYVNQYVIGEPLNIVKKYHFIGVDPQTGTYSFEDKNHDGQITRSTTGQPDDTYIVDLTPKFFGGLSMSVSYKNLQLNLVFDIRKQLGVNTIAQNPNYPGTLNANQPVDILTRWQMPGDITSVGRFTTSGDINNLNYTQLSDAGYTDASYIRLSNLSLSYNLPSSWVKKAGLQSCSLFFHTNDLFVITRYKGIDPETQIFGQLPPAKTLVGGVNFNF